MPKTKVMTAEEFYEWLCRPENQDKNWELDRGHVVEVPFGSERHGFVCANVNGVLGNFVFPRRCGYLCCNNAGLVVERDPDTVLGPDVAYYEDGKSLADTSWFFAIIPPKLGIEVVGTDDRITQMNRRVSRFLNCGVSTVWLVDPEERAVTVYQPRDKVCVLEEADELTGGDVLPGFRCRVREFFTLPGRP